MKKQVKRPRVNWYEVLCDLGDLEIEGQFWLFKTDHKNWSNNRIAYNVLKKNYSTTALRKYRFLHEFGYELL